MLSKELEKNYINLFVTKKVTNNDFVTVSLRI